jgi:general secretion pathway protein K
MTLISRQSSVASKNPIGMGPRPLPTADCRLSTNQEGVILIALLWILTALAIIALSFSRETFVEVAAARNAQSLEQSYFVARAGIYETIYQILQRRYAPTVRQEMFQDEPDPIDIGVLNGSFGGGMFRVDIQDESGKVNVNFASEEQLRSLVEAIGISKPDSDIITDSILDWKDPDNLSHLNGAENDYYETLNPPYKAKNGTITSMEELLLIRGITPEYFYGRPMRNEEAEVIYKYGLSRYLTSYSNRNQVNINHAPLPVLLSIPGMPPAAAQNIFERRHAKPFKTTLEISRDLGISLGTSTMPYLTVDQSSIYMLTASAHGANSKVRRIIRTVVNIDAMTPNKQYRTLYWNENVPDYESMTP